MVVAWLPSSCLGSHCPSLRFVGLSSSLWPCLNTEDHEEAVPLMSSYLTNNILERARWAAHVNHILQLHSPGGQEGGLQFGFNTSKEFEPFLLIMICRRKAPVTKRLWLKDAKLVRHSKISTRQRKSQKQPLDISQHRQDNTLQQEGKIKSI